MYYLLDNFISNNYTFENIIIGKKIKLDENISKYYIYYNDDNNDSPKDIYIKVPKIRIIYKLGNSNFNQERIALYPNYDLIDAFINFIKILEINLSECFQNKFKNLELSSILIKKENINYLKINTDDKVKIFSPINKLVLKDLKINNQIEFIIKINHIWIKNNKFGLTIQLFQIKYYPSIQELNLNLFDTDSSSVIIPIFIPNTNTDKEESIPISNKPKNMALVPSIEALLQARQKLKATSTS